jgi:large subunit ribosomal protein L15
MRLHDLKPRPGSRHRRKRLGQGESSGHGKTSGRGGKGQTARSGSSIRIGFEGGQMPLIRRMPKRGFNNKQFANRYIPVNLEALNRFDDGATVDESALRNLGLASGTGRWIKILGTGELTRKLTVSAHAFSGSARSKIEKLGGACQVMKSPASERAALMAKAAEVAQAAAAWKAAHPEKAVKAEKPAAAEKPAKGEKPDKSEKPPKGEKPAKGEKPPKGEKPDKSEKPAEKPAE